MKGLLAIVAAAAVGVFMLGLGQPDAAAIPAKGGGLQSLGFLEGTWSGTMGADWVEETWSAPHGDSIVGMFRWQAKGEATTMWELLSIKEEEGKPVLRLRHFDGKFVPWKGECEGVDAMAASEISANRVVFAAGPDSKGGLKSVEYKRPTANTLEITVSFKDEKRAALEFDLKRK